MAVSTHFCSHVIIVKVVFLLGLCCCTPDQPDVSRGHSFKRLNYLLQFIWFTQWLMRFEFPSPTVSSPLPHKPHPITLSSYLKCQQQLPITPPHAKTRSWGHANWGLPTATFICLFSYFPSLGRPSSPVLLLFLPWPRIIVFFLQLNLVT